ncbi:DUF4179 domain-containing protein [Cytobacillus gottheilii]|uniref:DUF4179 domain-containing protein n=1 Tax=Cytobacillus gottheilii TaxID=859144 RepID=UPI0008321C6C|nr:DUF4179 domain-containing protein [Cytobacillus gottheilii]
MIPAKTDKVHVSNMSDSSLIETLSWFGQHSQSLYNIALCHFTDHQKIEEVFYQSILKTDKESSRFKRETSYEGWVTANFVHKCQELAGGGNREETEGTEELIAAIYQLKKQEKEAILLTYVKGISYDETAALLQINMDQLKALLATGIQSIRETIGDGPEFQGCQEFIPHYLTYLNRAMERSEKIDFEIHLYHCQNCQEDLATFQEVTLMLADLPKKQMPAAIWRRIKESVEETEKQRQQKRKKRRRFGLITASVFTVLIALGFITGIFASTYYALSEGDPELRYYLQENLGERLSLVAEDNGIKIKIKSVIADEYQTLVYYEIEDLEEENQYMMIYEDGVTVENEYQSLNSMIYPRYFMPDMESDLNKREKNVYHGKLSLRPLVKDSATINLNIRSLHQVTEEGSINYEYTQAAKGEWEFELPLTKQPSTEYTLDGSAEIDGTEVTFNTLTYAPTSTVLQYTVEGDPNMQRMYTYMIDHLEVDETVIQSDYYGSYYNSTHNNNGSITTESLFDPLLGAEANEMSIHFGSVHLSVTDSLTIPLDTIQEYPYTFEYADSTISIDNVQSKDATEITLSNYETENRSFDSLQYNVATENDAEITSMEMDGEGVIVDKNGKEYDIHNPTIPYEELVHPRHIRTVERTKYYGNNVKPTAIELYGYDSTKYLDDVVKVKINPAE